MITRYTHKNLIWVDLESPTQEEVRSIMKEFHITPLVGEELLVPTVKPKVDQYDDFIYLILHFPAARHSHSVDSNQEVDFIIGKDFLITTRYDTIDPMHKFSKVFEVNSILDRSDIGNHAGFLFFYMITKLYKSIAHELEFVADSLRVIEDKMFNHMEREMVYEISKVSRELLRFKQALVAHRDVLGSFEIAGKRFFGTSFSFHLKTIIGEYYKIHNRIRFHIESVTELRETNNALLSTKQNEIMKIFTIMAFATFPLTLITSVFSMNMENIPIVDRPNAFWIIVGIMAIITVVFFAFFRYKKWL